MRKIIIGILIVGASFAGSILVLNVMSPSVETARGPALVAVPPLEPLTRTSSVVAPVAISNSAIRNAMEAVAPRNLAGKNDNLLKELLSNADIGWTLARGPLVVAGRPDGLTISTPLNGTFRATGQLSDKVGNIGGAVGNLLGSNVGRNVQNLTSKTLDQRADIRGNVAVTSRPALLPNWRIEPNLNGQATLSEVSLSLVGVKVNLGKEIKPLVDRSVSEQMNALQLRLRNDPFIEAAARREWAKMCRSISLGAVAPGVPDLWLEVRPNRAFAAQPRTDANAVTLVVGVQAETRIVPGQSKPTCPFPANVEIVPQMEQGRMNVALPIDIPLTEVNRILEKQIVGKSFPEDGSGAVEVNVRGASVAVSGDRLLISLRVKVSERSFLSFGAEAVVHVYGKPALDAGQQILRLTDVALDVKSEAAFGLLGAAARAAAPQLRKALADKAVIDLKPLSANARKSIAAAVAGFSQKDDGVDVDASVTDLRLVGIAFDAQTLRLIAEADGTVKVAVSALPGP